MSEAAAVEAVEEPVTVDALIADFEALGVAAAETLLVHSSLSALGWVAGGAQAVVDALRAVVTDEGTLVMPTHTTQYTDPAGWTNPPVPDDWVEPIRTSMPPYRPAVTPTRGMGAIPECFRTYPDVVRSQHPIYSFAAWGADADAVVGDHAYASGLGDQSPLAGVYERDGDVLLLGVGYDVNTSFHLAEYRASLQPDTIAHSVPVWQDGERVVVEYEAIETSADDFGALGTAFEAAHEPTTGTVGAADATLAGQRPLVDFAGPWLEANR